MAPPVLLLLLALIALGSSAVPDCRPGTPVPDPYGPVPDSGTCDTYSDDCEPGYECCRLPDDPSANSYYKLDTFTCQECDIIDYCLETETCPRGSTEIDACQYCKISGKVCKAECIVESADIAFILDGSGSVSPNAFTKSLDFVNEIVNDFIIGPNDVQIGVIQFSSSARIEFLLNEFSSDDGLATEIANIVQIRSGTRIDFGLDLARATLFTSVNGMRSNVPKIAFVVTDGLSGGDVKLAADNLRAEDVTLVAVGIGNANEAQLIDIADGTENVFTIDNFDELPNIEMALVRTICNLQDKIAGETSVPDCDPKCLDSEECLVKQDLSTECIQRTPVA